MPRIASIFFVPLFAFVPLYADIDITLEWEGSPTTSSVTVVSGLLNYNSQDGALHRVEGSQLWRKTVQAPEALRALYTFTVVDSGCTLCNQLDPRNSNRFVFPAGYLGEREVTYSVLEGPKAPTQLWIKPPPAASRGSLQQFTFPSQILQNSRTVSVYKPAGYRDEKRYPLVIVFDGEAYSELVPTPTILDNLIAAEKIPPVVAVLVGSIDWPTRCRELPCNPHFADFLAKELLPWVRQNYHLLTDAKQTILAGSSYGGLAAVYISLRYPDLFGSALSQSGAFGRNGCRDAIKQLAANLPQRTVRLYLDAGLLECRGADSILATNRQMSAELEKLGYKVRYAEFAGGHEYISWQGTLVDGLIFLLAPNYQ